MYPFPEHIKDARVMVFIDGENLAIRYGAILGGSQALPQVRYEKGVYVWAPLLNTPNHRTCDTIRRHYYTAVQGSDEVRQKTHDDLKAIGIEAPRVFRKDKTRGSKRVDISLAVEMLTHAHRRNYDLAVLVAGDEGYVPLVEAVASEGRRVAVWFFEHGLSPQLRNAADHFFDVSKVLLGEHADRHLK
jgi:uncharacterized LabA/DUF88 family protein